MKRLLQIVVFIAACSLLTGCKEKKKTDDIITTKPEKPKPSAPIRMQEYNQPTDVTWLSKPYHIEVKRAADDSLKMVKNEEGQLFVDNRISLRIIRSDGSVFLSRSFTKAAFEPYLDSDYRRTGILEGFVFDRVEGANLFFAASVSHPQTDEYIPMVVTISSQGEVGIRLDTDLDTSGGNVVTNNEEEDI